MEPHQLTRADARRVAVRAQRLGTTRPPDVVTAVRELSLLQLNPTAAVAPSADLVLWSRLGAAYDPDDLSDAIATQQLVELRGTVRPAEDIALYRADMAAWPGPPPVSPWRASQARWLDDNATFRRDVVEALRSDGPLPTDELPDTCVRPWRSSGWNAGRNLPMLLDLLVQCGEVAVQGWDDRGGKLWDLAERVYTPGPVVPLEEARQLRDERRLSALGIARARGPECPVEPLDVGEAGEPAGIEGVRGIWRVDPELLDAPLDGRAALLSPFDRLLHDRKRMVDLFDFEYALEMFKPAAQRRWGYYALPVLWGDRLVGKLDATADRRAGVLRVDALHEDEPFAPDLRDAVDAEIDDLGRWLGLEVVRADRR